MLNHQKLIYAIRIEYVCKDKMCIFHCGKEKVLSKQIKICVFHFSLILTGIGHLMIPFLPCAVETFQEWLHRRNSLQFNEYAAQPPLLNCVRNILNSTCRLLTTWKLTHDGDSRSLEFMLSQRGNLAKERTYVDSHVPEDLHNSGRNTKSLLF